MRALILSLPWLLIALGACRSPDTKAPPEAPPPTSQPPPQERRPPETPAEAPLPRPPEAPQPPPMPPTPPTPTRPAPDASEPQPVLGKVDLECRADADCTVISVWKWRAEANGYCTNCDIQCANQAGARRLEAWYLSRSGRGCPLHDCEPPARRAACVRGRCRLVPKGTGQTASPE